MNFEDIPDEILIIIVKKLDQKSIYNIYETSSRFRNLVCCYGLIKKLKLSLNTFATATFLKTAFFKDVAQNLQELDLCGAPDVSKSSLIVPLKKLKCLKKLDISYTQVTLVDLIDLYPICPTIHNIAVNFKLSNVIQRFTKQLQDIFQNFVSVHFVGSLNNLVHSNLPMLILQKSVLEYLKYTISWSENSFYNFPGENNVNMINFKKFEIFILNWKDRNHFTCYLSEFPIFTKLDVKKYEFIILNQIFLDNYTAYISKGFESKIFDSKLTLQEEVVVEAEDRTIFGNIAILIWNKDTTDFNNSFFSELKMKIANYFPHNVSWKSLDTITDHFWFYCNNLGSEERKDLQPVAKKKRVANPGVALNFDYLCANRQTLQLSIIFDVSNVITISPQCEYLKKLTFLSLCGAAVRYNVDFFGILFRSCVQLETLSIEGSFRCAFYVSRAIPISSSLKNIRLIDTCIDFSTLFSYFSQCSTLENIYLADQSTELNDLGDPNVLFEKCINLYSFCIYASMTDSTKTKKWQLFNKAKNRCKKPYLHMELHATNKTREEYNNKEIKMTYDPFIKVFKVLSVVD